MEAPIFVTELELSAPITDISLPERADGQGYNGAYLLVRLQRAPVGFISLTPDALDSVSLRRQVWEQFGTAINAFYEGVGAPTVSSLPTGGLPIVPALEPEPDDGDRPLISVVVCTRNRPKSVMVALRSLLAMHYRPFEIVLVDNAPSDDATKDAVLAAYGSDPRLHYVREPRPGSSCARNRGIMEAAADIVAFTDDDVSVDPWWLDGIVRGFRAVPQAVCVTGMVATAQLENSEQLYFHLRTEWGTLCERQIFDLAENLNDSPLYPYSTGIYGAGANCAFSRKILKEIGGFDEALGPGTISGGGEDIELFMRTILTGNTIVYEPTAIVSHYHRADSASLAKQIWYYGTGVTAALSAILFRFPRARREIPPRLIHGALRFRVANDRVKDQPAGPKGLLGKEIRGTLMGPWLYLRARRHIPA